MWENWDIDIKNFTVSQLNHTKCIQVEVRAKVKHVDVAAAGPPLAAQPGCVQRVKHGSHGAILARPGRERDESIKMILRLRDC